MLEVGVNTYCTLEEANKLVKSNYPIGDFAAYWVGLTDEQKEQMLINSAIEMETLPVAGAKVFYNQPLQFPRKSNFYRFNQIPNEVKDAQVVNALETMLVSIGAKAKDGRILTSALAEQKLRKWTCGGFKMGGF